MPEAKLPEASPVEFSSLWSSILKIHVQTYENREDYDTSIYLNQTRAYLIPAENGDSSLTLTPPGAAYPNKNEHFIRLRDNVILRMDVDDIVN